MWRRAPNSNLLATAQQRVGFGVRAPVCRNTTSHPRAWMVWNRSGQENHECGDPHCFEADVAQTRWLQ